MPLNEDPFGRSPAAIRFQHGLRDSLHSRAGQSHLSSILSEFAADLVVASAKAVTEPTNQESGTR